jgi:hypothetical protein
MNCCPGDLALVVGGSRENLGKVVQCLRLIDGREPIACSLGVRACDCEHGEVWVIDRELKCWTKDGQKAHAPVAWDKFLMPIRPEPDEILDAIGGEVDSTVAMKV